MLKPIFTISESKGKLWSEDTATTKQDLAVAAEEVEEYKKR